MWFQTVPPPQSKSISYAPEWYFALSMIDCETTSTHPCSTLLLDFSKSIDCFSSSLHCELLVERWAWNGKLITTAPLPDTNNVQHAYTLNLASFPGSLRALFHTASNRKLGGAWE